jgi:hypothetical protein
VSFYLDHSALVTGGRSGAGHEPVGWHPQSGLERTRPDGVADLVKGTRQVYAKALSVRPLGPKRPFRSSHPLRLLMLCSSHVYVVCEDSMI